tara:strand:- start:817 stop:2604 length:1788 start_codon:yes stop_codon:yes gene_type:complete
MSYFVASDKIPISQKSVRIPAENGTNYIANQEIRFRIDPMNVKFFNPQECYVEANVLVKPPAYTNQPHGGVSVVGPTPTKLQLDAETGFQSLCRRITITGSNGEILEEYDNYNTYVSVMYDYQTNESLKGKRALTEGSGMRFPDSRGTLGTSKSLANNTTNNPYWRNQDAATLNASWTADNFVKCKVCIPLHTGIMSNDKVFPNMLMGQSGIGITILLEDNNRVFRQLDGAMRFRRLPLNPIFLGKTNAGASIVNNGSFNEFFVKKENGILSVDSVPFCVGQKLGFQRLVDGNASIVQFQSASGTPVIKQIELDGGFAKITLNASVEINGKGMDSSAQDIAVFSESLNPAEATSYDVTYEVSDVNLVVQSIMPPPQYESEMMRKMKEGGAITYDFMSSTTYKYSQLASDRVANIRFPIENSRCKSILCVPTDATSYTTQEVLNASKTYNLIDPEEKVNDTDCPDFYLRSSRPGLEGITDDIKDFQFLYDGRLQPNRRVSLEKTSTTKSIDAQHLILLDQALSQAGITGHSFAKFNQNFVIGKPLALGDAVYDGRNKDFSLQVNYNSGSVKNKLWLSFVHHIRRIVISGDSVSVEV